MSFPSGGPVRPLRRIGAHQLAPLLSGWRGDVSGGGGPALPGYRALADRIRLLVLDGRIPVDAVLPSERALAEVIGASRTMTTATYRLLREEGFAAGSQGAGTWTSLPTRADPEMVLLARNGEDATADGRGDLAYAASEAPPEVHAAYTAALAELPRYLPGHGYVTAGLPGLRSVIAAGYTARGLPTSAEEILVTSGALHALHLVLALLAQRGDRVLVEHPTYSIALEAIRRAGARPVPLPVEDGWDADYARTVIRQTGSRLAFLIPDFHNPTGRLLDAAGREAMASALADAGCVAIVDETMAALDLRSEFGRPAPVPPPFAAVARRGAVVTLGSASKSVWGGLRIGWVRAERSSIRRLAVARSSDDLAGPVLEQLAAAQLLADLGPLLGRRRPELATRCRTMRAALADRLPEWDVPEPDGGLSLWCRLPAARSSELVTSARALGLTLHAGPRYGIEGAFESRLRLPFTRPAEHLTAAVGLLERAWRSSAATPEAATVAAFQAV